MAGRPPGTTPQPGDVVYVGLRASVQFAAQSAITLRVIRVHEGATYHGWCWIDGYQLDANGDAVERRESFQVCCCSWLIGVALGEDGLGLQFDDVELARNIGTAALAVILVEGGSDDAVRRRPQGAGARGRAGHRRRRASAR